MEDYKEIIKQMLLRYFTPIQEQGDEMQISTTDILEMVQGIIPSKPIDEHDVFEVMQQLGFKYELTIVDNEKMLYLWTMYRRDFLI
ncbi:hypothetical protein [Capnocytophaga catalasegens]|nr:hypothetical protein [Capnocytophaga catalasegens]GIZ15312.1 hypothetical protein RCZ03_13120 [Capnocytophaga catalasegens]